jgi:hypothetical protein
MVATDDKLEDQRGREAEYATRPTYIYRQAPIVMLYRPHIIVCHRILFLFDYSKISL